MAIARNTLYPETKAAGNHVNGLKLVFFASEHAHYSISKAAQMLGFGSSAVRTVAVDSQGRMVPAALESEIRQATSEGYTPLHVTATAGTTVLGSYDLLEAIADVCAKHNCWLHIDGSWGAPAIFAPAHAHKLAGSHRANSIAINPHKMMGVPLTCSFLLTPDLRVFHAANSLPAGYLFHGDSDEDDDAQDREVYDLADLTLQCGRRGDSLKLALGWIYYGREGYAAQITHAFGIAAYFAQRVADHPDLILVSENPPPCLQVCFYHAAKGKLDADPLVNTAATKRIARTLVKDGFMVDYAPGDKGSFFRAVVNRGTEKGTIDGLLTAVMAST